MRALQTLAFAFVAGIAAAQEQRDGRKFKNRQFFKTIPIKVILSKNPQNYKAICRMQFLMTFT